MNVKFEKNADAVAAKLILNIEKADYQDQVTATLKKLKQKAQMPGFRKGMVPMGLIQKMYGTEAKAEEVQKVIADAVNNYIKDENLQLLGEPMLADENVAADIAAKDDFEFIFDIALAPEISVEIDGKTSVDYYNIEVDDEAVQKQIDGFRRQNGRHQNAETFSEEDLVKGTMTENIEGEGAITIEEATLMPRFFVSEEQKAIFVGAKNGDAVVFNPSKAYEGRDAELASLLRVDKEEAVKHTGDFTLQISEINHFEMGEVNEDLMRMVYPDGTVKTEEEFTARVKTDVEAQYAQDSDYKFLLDLKTTIMNKVGEVKLAEDLLKKMVLSNARNEENKAQIEAQIGEYLDDLRWSLVRTELAKKLDVKVDDAALMAASKKLIKIQMAQYGILNFPEDQLEQFAAERIKDEKQRDNIVSNAIDNCIVEAAKKVVKLNAKSVSIADFNKMFE